MNDSAEERPLLVHALGAYLVRLLGIVELLGRLGVAGVGVRVQFLGQLRERAAASVASTTAKSASRPSHVRRARRRNVPGSTPS